MSLDSSVDYLKMGKITLEMLAKSPSHTKKRRDETAQQYARRLTHLYFSEKNIDEIVSRPVRFHRLFDSPGSIGISLFVNHINFNCSWSLSFQLLIFAYELLNELTAQQHATLFFLNLILLVKLH